MADEPAEADPAAVAALGDAEARMALSVLNFRVAIDRSGEVGPRWVAGARLPGGTVRGEGNGAHFHPTSTPG